jgi:hypothetical protein
VKYRLKYSVDIPCYISEHEPIGKSSKMNKFIRTGLNTAFGLGTTNVKLSDYIEIEKNAIVGGMYYDTVELGKNDKQLQDGDLLPEWVYFWLKLCKEICNLANENNLRTGILALNEKEIYDLDSHELCSQIGSNLWTMGDYGIIILWGIEPSYYSSFNLKKLCFTKKLHFPMRCRGCIFPTNDGCGIKWCLNFEDGKRIGIPFDVL